MKNQRARKKPGCWRLLPLQLIVGILPLITVYHQVHTRLNEYGWYSVDDTRQDFFLFYKAVFFLLLAVVMLVLLIRELGTQTGKERKSFFLTFLPVFCYLLLAVLSTIGSVDYGYSLLGMYEVMEPLPVLLGYGITAMYAYTVLRTGEELRLLLKPAVLGMSAVTLIGVLQFLGYDLLEQAWVQRLIVPGSILENSHFTAVFPKGMVYTTLFNPNYVGSYVAMLLPIALAAVFFLKERGWRIYAGITAVALLLSLLGSRSQAGVVAALAVLLLFVFLFLRQRVRRWYLIAPGVAVLGVALLVLGIRLDFPGWSKVAELFAAQRQEYALESIDTTGNGVKIKYKGTELTVLMAVSGSHYSYVVLENGTQRDITYTEEGTIAGFTLESGEEILVQTILYQKEEDVFVYAFQIMLDGKEYRFSNQLEPGNYTYINQLGRAVECVAAPNALRGYEKVASSRGYVWGQSLPLLTKYFLIGSGPDTFALVFPQNDYVAQYRAEADGVIFTRPHNLYLQVGVQTGVLSLLAYLACYLVYLAGSLRGYLFRRYTRWEEWFGCAVFLGTVGFLVAGLANDSLIVVSPIYWLLLGAGLAINRMELQVKETEGVK